MYSSPKGILVQNLKKSPVILNQSNFRDNYDSSELDAMLLLYDFLWKYSKTGILVLNKKKAAFKKRGF